MTIRRRSFLKALGLPAVLGLGGGLLAGAPADARSFYYDGPVSDHFDGERFFLPGVKRDKTFTEMWEWHTDMIGNHPWPKSFPSPFHDRPPARVGGNGLRVAFIGHSSFLIQVAGLNILIDPVFSDRVSPFGFVGPKRVNPPGIALADLPPIDWALVTHNHYDHMDVESLGAIAERHRNRILVALGNDAILADAQVRTEVIARDWGQNIALSDRVRAHLVPAKHWSARGILDRGHALWCSFVLETPAGVVHILGDTGYHRPLFTSVRDRFGPPRLSLIPIGAFEPRGFLHDYHIAPEEGVQAFIDCGARSAIGCHWGTFKLTDEAADRPPLTLAAALKKRGIAPERFQAYRPGQVWRSDTGV